MLLDEHDSTALLASFGIETAKSERLPVDDDMGILAAAGTIGYPVVLKGVGPSLAHKTDAGAVVLDIPTEYALTVALKGMRERLASSLSGFLVAEMLPPGLELILGAVRDPSFGHVVTVGLGGVFVELMARVAIRAIPVTPRDAMDMIDELAVGRLLQGFRGHPTVDKAALAQTITVLSRIVEVRPDIEELDINPLICRGDKTVAADALVRLSPPEPAPPPKPPVETLEVFYSPATVAVLGASRKEGKGGNVIVKNLLGVGYKGPVYPVNPGTTSILGRPSYPSAKAIGAPIDLAIVVVPRDKAEAAVDDAISAGARGIIMVTAGFSDASEEGRRIEARMASTCRAAGVRLMGPNSIGTLSSATGLCTSITTQLPLGRGTVSVFGQSGIFNSGLPLMTSSARGWSLAKVACLGNKADVDEADMLEYLLGDEDTSAIGLYLEGITDGKRLTGALRRNGGAKPVAILLGGGTTQGARAVASHTGSLAVDGAMLKGVARQTGSILVDSLGELIDVLELIALVGRRPRGRRLGVVSISGMGCVAAADHAAIAGLEIPPLADTTLAKLRAIAPPWAPLSNPVDMWSVIEQRGPWESYDVIGRALLQQDDIDALLVVFLLIRESSFDVEEVVKRLKIAAKGKPIMAAFLGGEEAVIRSWTVTLAELKVPAYHDVARAIHTYGRVVNP